MELGGIVWGAQRLVFDAATCIALLALSGCKGRDVVAWVLVAGVTMYVGLGRGVGARSDATSLGPWGSGANTVSGILRIWGTLLAKYRRFTIGFNIQS